MMLLGCVGTTSWAAAEKSDSIRVFSEEQPLIYEDAWDLWPYAFLNDVGEPVGYNIDLLKLIFDELHIPYKIKLKTTKEALEDLKAGRSDLMCGMDASFHNDYAQYGKSVIQIFTHSVVHQKGEPVLIKTLEDLAKHRVIVHEGSFSHHLMQNRGWGANAIPYDDMQEAVQYAHNNEGSQIVWNTLSLKWLIYKFHYDDLELTPVNIQHGEYKFMSNNPRLLAQLDSAFTYLNSTGRLQPIQNKWFYPESTETGIPSWVWYVVVALLTIIVIFLIYYIVYRIYERKMTKNMRKTNTRLSLILNTSKVHIWLYDIAKRTVISPNREGKKVANPLSPHFLDYYLLPKDYEQLCMELDDMARQKMDHKTMEVRTRRGDSDEEYIFAVDLSVMKRNKDHSPAVIIGATVNITDDKLRRQQQRDAMLRYRHIFNSAMVDTVSYDANGFIDDMNEKASKAIPGGVQRVVERHVSIQSVMDDPTITVDNMEPTYLTQIYKSPDDPRPLNRFLKRDELYYELQLIPVRDDDGHLLAIYGTGRDVTEVEKSYSRLQKNIVALQKATDELQDYVRNIDYILKNGGVRMASYSPDTHMLTIYREIGHIQLQLTQTRLLALADDSSKRMAQRLLKSMDNGTKHPIRASIKSLLRAKGNKQLSLYFSFVPIIDADGNVTEYIGMCRDISDIKATEEQLALETTKAQEVETVKNAFLHNMSYEIRTPLTSVVGFADLFEQDHTAEEEQLFIREIRDNSEYLLALINDILFLSRLDAQMIELKLKMTDICPTFETHCQTAWTQHRQPGVTLSVENPYEHLVLEVDEQNLGHVIEQIVANAAYFTREGQVRVRCDYTGEDLIIAVHATDGGISEDSLPHVFDRFIRTHNNGTGLEMSICYELVRLMGGKIHIKSDAVTGTNIWISIPSKCGELVRKNYNVTTQ